MKQLKAVSGELSRRTVHFHNTSAVHENIIFFPPKSGAKKAEWISAIASFFQEHGSNSNIYTILDGPTAPSSAAAASATRSPPDNAAYASARKSSPAKSARKSAKKQSAAKAAKKSSGKKSSPKSKKSSSAAMAADEALARSLQNRYMQEDAGLPLGGNGLQGWGGPLADSYLMNHVGNASIASGSASEQPSAGLKRSANDNTKPQHMPAKVKTEPLSHTATSAGTLDEEPLRPRDLRESNMVSSLREMGFRDTREILTALRAVAAQREDVSIGMYSNGYSTEQQVEDAMMWIVTQREEAAEAQKLDEARVSSEQADAALELSRKNEMERELKNADLADLVGSVDEDVEIRSRHFPDSVLLRNQSVRSLLGEAASANSLGKDNVIRLLNLEKKARKWYGTVLPYSYFQYVCCPRLEGGATEGATGLCQRLTRESDELEKVMYNLSEQVEGGVGSVPKVFLEAQTEAQAKGRPTASPEGLKIGHDDEIEVLQQPILNGTGRPRDVGASEREVIDLA